ncbi:hypothetical protein EAE96_002882 [Botrytis aclada]|nr:hypothetical protein EAE96_002882 [Botrytis aclada]
MSSTPQPESRALTELRPFSRLPFELQARIFREAQPDPMVNVLCLEIDAKGKFVSINPRYDGLNRLLLAWKESYAEIFRRFQKIEVAAPPSFADHEGKLYSYFRFDIDILLVQGMYMVKLYQMGGSFSLENITQLALIDTVVRSWYCPRTIFSVRMKNAAKLYTLLSQHCPALSKLWLIVEPEFCGVECPSGNYPLRILDVSDRLMDLDLRPKCTPNLCKTKKHTRRMYLEEQI